MYVFLSEDFCHCKQLELLGDHLLFAIATICYTLWHSVSTNSICPDFGVTNIIIYLLAVKI